MCCVIRCGCWCGCAGVAGASAGSSHPGSAVQENSPLSGGGGASSEVNELSCGQYFPLGVRQLIRGGYILCSYAFNSTHTANAQCPCKAPWAYRARNAFSGLKPDFKDNNVGHIESIN